MKTNFASVGFVALATSKGVSLPAAEEASTMETWSQRKDFDHDYLQEMAVDHRTTVALFEKAAQSDDPEIAAFAHRTLPTLRHYLRMLQEGCKVAR